MSHTLNAQCSVCGAVVVVACPECPPGTDHGTAVQDPWWAWHRECWLVIDPDPNADSR